MLESIIVIKYFLYNPRMMIYHISFIVTDITLFCCFERAVKYHSRHHSTFALIDIFRILMIIMTVAVQCLLWPIL